MIRYFAYGSNMDKNDLDKWCISKGYNPINFINLTPAKLGGYKLSFNYYSKTRGAGAANIMKSCDDCVYGLLVEMKEEALPTIRKKEGYPDYYCEICIDVEKFDGTVTNNVITYKVVKGREMPVHQPPTREYLQLIITNAKNYGFPAYYIKYLESIETID